MITKYQAPTGLEEGPGRYANIKWLSVQQISDVVCPIESLRMDTSVVLHKTKCFYAFASLIGFSVIIVWNHNGDKKRLLRMPKQ